MKILVLCQSDVSTVVHPSEQETLGIGELRQLARHPDGARLVEICWNLFVQAFMRALVMKTERNVIEAVCPARKARPRVDVASSFSVDSVPSASLIDSNQIRAICEAVPACIKKRQRGNVAGAELSGLSEFRDQRERLKTWRGAPSRLRRC